MPTVFLWYVERGDHIITIYDKLRPTAPARFKVSFPRAERGVTQQYFVWVDAAVDPEPLKRVQLIYRPYIPDEEVVGRLSGRWIGVDFRSDTTTLLLAPGTHEIEIFSPEGRWHDYVTIDHSSSTQSFPINLSEPSSDFDSEINTASVVLQTEPPGAQVICDDVMHGFTPWYGSNIPIGRHHISLWHPNTYPTTVTFEVDSSLAGPDGDFQVLRLDTVYLVGNSGWLSVVTNPEGASISVDGSPMGASPVREIKTSPGRHRVSAQAPPFYVPKDTLVDVGYEAHVSVQINLDVSTGCVAINSEPTDAEVIVDETHSWGNTPLTRDDVPIGEHRFRLRKSGFSDHRFSLIVQPDDTTETTEVFQQEYGFLTVYTRPRGAAVFFKGPTSAGDGKHQLLTPTPRKRVLTGEYIVQSFLSEHNSLQDTVWIEPHESEFLYAELRPQTGELEIISTPPGADVFCNGELVSETTPVVITCPVGKNRIKVAKEGYSTYTNKVIVQASQRFALRPELKRKGK